MSDVDRQAQALAHHFAAWEGWVFVAREQEGMLLASDGMAIFNLPDTYLVFDSRRTFPELPVIGQTLKWWEHRTNPSNADLNILVRDILAKETLPLTMSDWLLQQSRDQAHVLILPDGTPVLLAHRYARLIESDRYLRQIDLAWFGSAPQRPIVCREKKTNHLRAIIMPCVATRDDAQLVIPKLVEEESR